LVVCVSAAGAIVVFHKSSIPIPFKAKDRLTRCFLSHLVFHLGDRLTGKLAPVIAVMSPNHVPVADLLRFDSATATLSHSARSCTRQAKRALKTVH
jgi:hypothetical protein